MITQTEKPGNQRLAPYLDRFADLERRLVNQDEPPWLGRLRQTAMARFSELGFPTVQDEDWRFTNIAPIMAMPFRPILDPGAEQLDAAAISGGAFSDLPAVRLVFVNGRYAPGLSTASPSEAGIEITNLAQILVRDPGLVEPHFAAQSARHEDAFTALNSAFFQDGALIRVGKGRTVREPILLLFVSDADEEGMSVHLRNLLLFEEGSQATILESHLSLSDTPSLTNAVTEVVLRPGAVVEHCKFQDASHAAFHMSNLLARLERSSNYTHHSMATGARLSRNNIFVSLAGEGVECILNGLYVTKGEQLADHYMLVEHVKPHCASHEYFNGILDNSSRGVFHGRILVQREAQKTDAKQTNKNLLLSNEATVDTKPQLEIYANDVKCTHGATIGQLNEESIFYLRARGIGAETARRMLIHAFAGEIIERIKCVPARDELDQLIWNRLEQNPHIAEVR